MRVLLTGANGFIGAQLVSALRTAGHEVVACVRDPIGFQRRFPTVTAFRTDFNDLTVPKDWQPLLRKMDAVINCAGVMNDGGGQSMTAIHDHAPTALFAACEREGIKKIIQVSAVSIGAETDYAQTKRRADDFLMTLDTDWTIFRPSLIYAKGAYGGTTAIRGLAATPIATPLPADGQFEFQPIHINDFARSVITALEDNRYARKVLSPCGPDTLTLRDMVVAYRSWLGLPPVPQFSVPLPLMRMAGHIGDWTRLMPVTSNQMAQLEYGNSANYIEFSSLTGIQSRSLAHMLEAEPANTGELWQARGWWLQLVVRFVLLLYWGGMGVLGLNQLRDGAQSVWYGFGLPPFWVNVFEWAPALWSLFIAAMLTFSRSVNTVFRLQVVTILIYLAIYTYLLPRFWLDPFGPLLATFCLLGLVVVHRVLNEER